MINLGKSYSEGVGPGFQQLKHTPFAHNVRYQIAKNKVDDLFLKWLSLPNTQKIINQLITDLKTGKHSVLITQPNPLFTNKMTMSGMQQSAILSSPNNKFKQSSPSTPPRNDNLFEIKHKLDIGDLSQSLTQSQIIIKKAIIEEKERKHIPNYDLIPQFYFAEKPINHTLQTEQNKIIQEIFGKSESIDSLQFEQITVILCGLTKYLSSTLFRLIDPNNVSGKMQKALFLKYWNLNMALKEPKERCYQVLKCQEKEKDYIIPENLKTLMRELLDKHPGLEFLQSTPEFQDRYAETVIQRIFYRLSRKDNGKITWRDFKQSNLFDVLEKLSKEDDINKITEYFSYEHFYVIYCKFWELDGDHDFHITKEDFSRYSGHGLSRKVIDRIFDQIPRRFKSQIEGKMSYEDFIYFIQCEEDKTTIQSIEYWFKIIDLDDNGIISGQEMEYFYDELKQRMDFLNHEPILFQDFFCQMVDLLHPDQEIHFKMSHFKQNLQTCGVFFNFLTNLNKLVGYENRDPFQVKNDITEHPEFTEWDRFAFQEYLRLAQEEETQEQGEVFEGDNIWDSEDTRGSL